MSAALSLAAQAGPIQDVEPGKWYEIPNTKMRAVTPSPSPGGDSVNVMDAWGGAAYDTDREQLLVWGGGHSDYAGNEVYAFGPMTSDSPTWKRLSDPSPAQPGDSATYADGKPRSTHTYGLLSYNPNTKKMVSFGLGSTWTTGGENLQIFAFNPANGQWDGVSAHPRTKSSVQGTSAQYDSSTGLIWHRGFGDTVLESYNSATGAQATYQDGLGYIQMYVSTAIDPVRKIMVGVGGYDGNGPIGGRNVSLVVWNLASPGTAYTVNTSGDKAPEGRGAIGFEFHKPSGTFVAWWGGSTVYRLTPPSDLRNGTWQWTALQAVSGSATPTAGNPQGTYGRFRYIESLDIFIAVNKVDGNVYTYRLGGTAAPTNPAVSLSASPTQVSLQGTSTLTWSSTNADSCTASGAWSGTKSTSGTQAVGPLSVDSTFTLVCSKSGGGSTTKSTTVTIASATPPATVQLSANPASISSGGTSVLSWTSVNATSCTAGGTWSGSKATQGSQTVGPLSNTGSFTLSCTGSGGAGQASTTVTVSSSAPAPAPTLSFAASPASVTSGGSTQLSWTSTNVTTCSASGGWTGSKSASGQQTMSAITSNKTYSLQCTGAGGSVSRTATVTVAASTPPPPPPSAAPTVSVSASPATVAPGGVSTLTWSSTNATSCTASGGWSGPVTTSGSTQTSTLQSATTFSISCTGAGGTSEDSTQVAVVASATGGDAAKSSGGGGSLEWLTLAVLVLVVLAGCARSARIGPAAAAVALTGVAAVAQAGDITTLTISSSNGGSNVPVTFGQIFKPGDVPSGTNITATTSSGTAVPLQVDRKATHGDGSLRHAVLTASVPSLSSAQSVKLATGGSAPGGSAVTLANLLATSFDAEARLNVGGTTYTLSARPLLQSGTPTQWLNGPLVSEWVVGGPVKTSAGTAHQHLAAYFHIRAYAGQPVNRVRVDVIIENGWTMVPGPSQINYSATVLVGGSSVYTKTLTHYDHSRWHRTFWWGTNPAAYVKQDPAYLQATGAVPKYANVTLNGSLLSGLRQDVEPMSNGDLLAYFPTTGGSGTIGPFPLPAATYIMTTDQRAFNSMRAMDDAAGSYGVHFRDELTGRPVSIGDRTTLTVRFSQAEIGQNSTPDISGTSPNTPDDAHQPSLAFLSYIVTGDYYYMEEMQFWSSWNHLLQNPVPPDGYRQGSKGIMGGQVRGLAWMMRNLGQAAYATPDDHPYKAVLVNSLIENLKHREAMYPDNASANKLGALQSLDGYELFAPWMDDFYTWSMGYLVDLGFPAQKMRNWKAQFPVGRMGTTDYCYKNAAAYHLTVGTSNTSWFPNFATLYQQNFGANTSCAPGGTMSGYPESPEGYVANLQPSLAVAVDAGVAGAQAAWDRLMTASPRPDFRDYPNWAVVPRGTAVGGGTGAAVSLSASPTTVQSGGSTTLSWSSSGVTSCTASGGWTGSKATSGTQSVGPLTAATTYTLSCTGTNGTVNRSVDVTIGTAPPPPPPPATAPTVTISANPTSVASGGSTTLTWSSTNATSCTASNGWTGTKATSGTQAMSNLTANRTYALSCTGAGGSASASALVMVTTGGGGTPPPPPPTTPAAGVTFSASPTTVTSGGSTTLTWSSTNATSCTATGGWTGSKATSGTQAMSNLTSSTTYSLQCTGAGGASATASASVTVTAATVDPTTPSTDSGGGGSLGWLGAAFLLALQRFSRRWKLNRQELSTPVLS